MLRSFDRTLAFGVWLARFLWGHTTHAFSSSPDAFSLSAYQQARASETAHALDGSRFHLQVLIVDTDNQIGRIAEGLIARVAEYNDGMFILFPTSATFVGSSNKSNKNENRMVSYAEQDATAPENAVQVCRSLGLDMHRSSADGIAFDESYLDGYDLVLTTTDTLRNKILGSLSFNSQQYYGPKLRLLSEFLSMDFIMASSRKRTSSNETFDNSKADKEGTNTQDVVMGMLDGELQDRVLPFLPRLAESQLSSSNLFAHEPSVHEPRMALNQKGAAVPNRNAWPETEAALILAAAGITRFCLDTIETQMKVAFNVLLQNYFKHLDWTWEEAEETLRMGSSGVVGYFSPKQRRVQWEEHMVELQRQLEDEKAQK
mmetsp:Transcript_15164/g.33172  ORF Transcript_15164/g.33172 Transcript_15164/m.33172 type:complete len:373 (-) Transcript_15164:327-1445(-)